MDRTKVCLCDLHWLCIKYAPRPTAATEIFGSDFWLRQPGLQQTADWYSQLFFKVILVSNIWCEILACGKSLLCFRCHARYIFNCPECTAEDFPWHIWMYWINIKRSIPTSVVPAIAGCWKANHQWLMTCFARICKCSVPSIRGSGNSISVLHLMSKLWRWGAEFV